MLTVYRSNGENVYDVDHIRVGTDIRTRRVVLSIVQPDGEEIDVPLSDVTIIQSDAAKMAERAAPELRTGR